MGYIKINNIQLYAYHGCLEEEHKIGSDYRVDVTIKSNLKAAAESDLLKDTINYVQVNQLVKEEMRTRSKLLEHVAQRILDRMMKEMPAIEEVTVDVSKINPPIGGHVEMVTITLTLKR